MAEPQRRAAPPPGYHDRNGAVVAGVALIALVVIVAVAFVVLPDEQRGQNVIAIATAAFGVIGAIVGAYFGVSSANRAAELIQGGDRPGPEAD